MSKKMQYVNSEIKYRVEFLHSRDKWHPINKLKWFKKEKEFFGTLSDAQDVMGVVFCKVNVSLRIVEIQILERVVDEV